MATSGSFGSWVLNAGSGGSVSFTGTWSSSISRPNTSNTAKVTVTAKVTASSGDYVTYQLYVNGSKVKESTGYHAPGSTYTLTYSYNQTVGDGSGSLTGKVYVRTYASKAYYKDTSTKSYSLSYGSKTTYTISYNANGGTGAPGAQTKYYGTKITLSTTKPTRTGYTFKGWATSSGGAVAYAAGATYSSNAAATLYAVWQANTTYTVTYDANDGTGAPASQSGYSGTSLTLSSTKPTKASTSVTYTVTYDKVDEEAVISKASDSVTRTTTYSFSSWNTKADGTGTKYTAGQTITLSANLTLYAIYTDATSGNCTLPTGTLDQMTLAGWATNPNSGAKVSDPYTPSGDITLYAIWAAAGTGGMLRFFLPNADAVDAFTAGTKVRLVGLKDRENDGIYTIASASQREIDGQYRISLIFEEDFQNSGSQDASETYIEIYGEGTYTPDMDYICAKDNRLWGCSSRMRTIYASALGDPTDFWTFAGDSLDAYQVAVGTAGDFTGCVAMNNTVIFMKQHTIHKMMGDYPAEYALYTYNIDGTSESNGLSALNCNGIIIYVSEHGVATYSGSSSGKLSVELGEGNMTDALASFNGEQYYLTFRDKDDVQKTYIFDTRYNVWIQQDYGDVIGFTHLDDDDYVLINHADTNAIYHIDSGEPLEDDWQITFKDFYESASGNWGSTSHIYEKKRYTGITMRIELPEDSWIKVELKCDDGRWYTAARKAGKTNGAEDFHIVTPRCDRMKMKLSGHGPMTILSMERQFTVGSRR